MKLRFKKERKADRAFEESRPMDAPKMRLKLPQKGRADN